MLDRHEAVPPTPTHGSLPSSLLSPAVTGCGTIRYTNSVFDTGRSIAAGKNELGIASGLLPESIPSVYYEHGFAGDWQLSVGYGIHGMGGEISHGPAIDVNKTLLESGNLYCLGATGDADIDRNPTFGGMLQAGLAAGFYPGKRFTLYGQAEELCIRGERPGCCRYCGAL